MTVAKTKAEGLKLVQELVADYQANCAYFRSDKFDEAATRTGFVDKLFEALGWDVTAVGPDAEVLFHARQTTQTTAAGEDK